MPDTASLARQSDPDHNHHFRRRWGMPQGVTLTLLPDAPDTGGEPRVGLLMPPAANAACRRHALRVFGSMAAAIAAKRQMEAGQ